MVDLISPELSEWLDAIQADDPASEALNQEDDEDEDDEPSSFDGHGQRLIWSFPTDALYEEYLAALEGRPEEEVRTVIRRLLIPPSATGGDHLVFEAYIAERDKKNKSDEEERGWQQWANSDYVQRVVRYYGGMSDNPPWEGITWIANLLPDRARLALSAIEAYFFANMHAMRDGMIHALSDAEGIIRARYVGFPQSSGDRLQVLHNISPREFEQLVEHLYASRGYQTELTPSARDGGRDIIATLSDPGRQERILIECKHYKGNIGVGLLRQLLGVVSNEHATKGTLVTTADFSRGARTFAGTDSRIELISGRQLVVMLNEHLGWTWPARIEHYTRQGPFKSIKR